MKAPSEKRRPGRQRGHRISVTAPKHLLAVKIRLGLSDAILTYRDAAAELTRREGVAVSPGTVYKFAHGIEPKRANLRRAFGLPLLVVSREAVCATCGQLHQRARTCPNKAAARKPRRRATLRTERLLTWAVLALLAGGGR